jgi:hypothetical protein
MVKWRSECQGRPQRARHALDRVGTLNASVYLATADTSALSEVRR